MFIRLATVLAALQIFLFYLNNLFATIVDFSKKGEVIILYKTF